jgi:hypothetical protein
MPPDIGTDFPDRLAAINSNLSFVFIWLHGFAEIPLQHRTTLDTDLAVMHGERQPLILDPGAGNQLDGASKLTGELFQERAATSSDRMMIAAIWPSGFQAMIADIGDAPDAGTALEILQSSAADDSDGYAGRVPELLQ